MKQFITTLLAIFICVPFLLSGCSASTDAIQKGNKGYIESVSIGYTPSISKGNPSSFSPVQTEELFTYTGILDGSLVITSVVWQHTNVMSVHPIMYIPHEQNSFNIWDGRHWVHISNIVIGQESSLAFDWEITSD